MGLLPVVERLARRALNARGLKSRYLRTSIAVQHFYDAKGRGSLPTVVILHGISSTATPFAPVVTRLLPHVKRVIAPEAPGHGFSEAPRGGLTPETLSTAMTELLDRELDEPAIIFGNSLGGAVALGYALARPERTRGLFLASPAGATMEQEHLDAFLTTFTMKSPKDANAFLNRLYHRRPWFGPLIASDVQRLFQRDVITSFTASVSSDDLFTPAELATLKMPIRFIWGKSERLLPAENLAFWKRYLPAHAEIEEPEGFGHCAHLDEPNALAQRIVAFARRV